MLCHPRVFLSLSFLFFSAPCVSVTLVRHSHKRPCSRVRVRSFVLKWCNLPLCIHLPHHLTSVSDCQHYSQRLFPDSRYKLVLFWLRVMEVEAIMTHHVQLCSTSKETFFFLSSCKSGEVECCTSPSLPSSISSSTPPPPFLSQTPTSTTIS